MFGGGAEGHCLRDLQKLGNDPVANIERYGHHGRGPIAAFNQRETIWTRAGGTLMKQRAFALIELLVVAISAIPAWTHRLSADQSLA